MVVSLSSLPVTTAELVQEPNRPRQPVAGQADATPRGALNFDQLLSVQPQPIAPSPAAKAGTQVKASRTQLSGEQAANALANAWETRFGEPPNRATVAILTAQWSHETAGGKSMFNYNFGGIKGSGPSGLTVMQRTREGWGPTERTITDGFRAYQSAEEGAADYISLLQRRYAPALDAAQQGDPHQFVHQLKRGGYFTGNERLYAKSVSRLATQAMDSGLGALGEGGRLPPQELLIRPVDTNEPSIAFGGPSEAAWEELADYVSQHRAEAMVDEMSRAALKLALNAGSRNREDR